MTLLAAAALAGLLLLPPGVPDGAWVFIIFAVLWFGLFFLSLPLQRRYTRALDARRPGARLAGGRLSVPLAGGEEFSFDLREPHALTFGWYEVVIKSTGGPTSNTRALMTYAILSQGGRELFLQAEESVSEAQSAGWPHKTSPNTPELRVRLWAGDLVTLVEALRSHAPPAAAVEPPERPAQPAQPVTQPTDFKAAREERIREWPENPLPARNRHEVSLFLDWLKAEVVSRAHAAGGEVCVGRVRGADPAAAPDTYRFVFTLLEPDPPDESDFGGGVSSIFDPAELLLLLARMEREGQFGPGGGDERLYAALVLTHRTTREVEALRRANARGAGLIEQLFRFPQAEGQLSEDAVKGSVKRWWLRGARERFDLGALEARRQSLAERRRLLQLPSDDSAGGQAKLARELRDRLPEYLEGLRRAGFEDAHVMHPLFSHGHHLARFAARALGSGKPEEARAAFDAWAAAEPSALHFLAREFADAVYESNLAPETAAPLVPEAMRDAFFRYHQTLLDPGYEPWSY
ncbi:MAG TPA: hypothetical protein VF668_05350 [Pyrinomonadaceae bacterium]